MSERISVVRARDALDLRSYRIEEDRPPDPGPGEVRLRVRACGIGYVDALTAAGGYQVKPPLPFVPGVDLAGEVAALGPGVAGPPPGTRVVPMVSVRGAMAQAVLASADQLAPIPPTMSFEQAASLRTNVLTALYALHDRGRVRPGERVLVFGAAGGVGGAAVQVAKRLGARVVAAASTPEKRAHARLLGADAVVDTAPDGWRDRLAAACGGGPDLIVDPVCGPLFEAAFRSLGWNGRHLVIGFAGGPIPALPANLPLLKGAALVGVNIRTFNRTEPVAAEANRRRLRQWLAEDAIVPPVGTLFPLERFREALAHAASGTGIGKTVLRMD